MICQKNGTLSFAIITFIFMISTPLLATNVYVDQLLSNDITNGTYSIVNRNNMGSDGNAYNTIQEAINNCTSGDTIYMRGGIYALTKQIDIAEAKNGSLGRYTTLCSLPGEWAILNGTNISSSIYDMFHQNVIGHPTEYGVHTDSQWTRFWKFERFEVTGGRSGIWLKAKNCQFRHLYIHNNGRDTGDSLSAGLYLPVGQDNIIEYCWFRNNDRPNSTSNDANLMFDTDILDTSSYGIYGGALNENICLKNNIVRYNLSEGGARGIRTKHQQKFGYIDRDPNSTAFMAYKNWGNKIHNNIVLNARTESIIMGSDFDQVYNNIVNRSMELSQDGDVPIMYHMTAYNNTLVGGATILANAGYSEQTISYYYKSDPIVRIVHPHVYFFNNIIDGTSGSLYNNAPFCIARDTPEDSYNWSMRHVIINRNFAHNNTFSYSGDGRAVNAFIRHNNVRDINAGGSYRYLSVAEFDTHSAIWRGVVSVINWQNNSSGLFMGTSGVAQYIPNGNFVLSGSYTINNGGLGSTHPYLSGVTIPSYIGAVDPNNSGWINTVFNLANIHNLISGGEVTSTTDPTPPDRPDGVTINIIQ